jgi:hypothetical protein
MLEEVYEIVRIIGEGQSNSWKQSPVALLRWDLNTCTVEYQETDWLGNFNGLVIMQTAGTGGLNVKYLNVRLCNWHYLVQCWKREKCRPTDSKFDFPIRHDICLFLSHYY